MLLVMLALGLFLPTTHPPTMVSPWRGGGRATGIFHVTLCTSNDHCDRPLSCCAGALFRYCCVNGQGAPLPNRNESSDSWPGFPVPAL